MYHKPVLLREVTELLKIRPAGIYVDATFGSGGHSRKILEQLKTGRLVAFDQDEDARLNSIDDKRFLFVPHNFRYLKNFLKAQSIFSLDGLIADLGVSSWQIDTPERGFSTRYPGSLDMRMDRQQEITAESILNTYSEEKLAQLFHDYAEISKYRELAHLISESRKISRIISTDQLSGLSKKFAQKNKENQFLARVFQSIRIEVNGELESLKEMLLQATEMLNKGGRIAVISYHSLEDRLVKNYFTKGNFEGKENKDFYGNLIRPLEPLNRKVITPSKEEIQENPRSRSARLRAAEKK